MSDRAPGKSTTIIGALEGLDHGIAIGWAFDPTMPEHRLVVEILCDDYAVSLDRANIFRDDLRSRSTGDACHGFEITIPAAALRAGSVLSARICNTESMLEGRFRLGEARAAARRTVRGEVSRVGLRLSGWVNPIAFQSDPLIVGAFEGDRMLAETVADRPLGAGVEMPPLARAFLLRLPMTLADGALHHVTVRVGELGEPLGGPLDIAAWPSGVDDALRDLAGTAGVPGSVAHALNAAAHALECSGRARSCSVSFSDYATWARAFPPLPSTPKCKVLPVTLVLYGEAPADSSGDLADPPDEPGSRVICAPDGRVRVTDWPVSGLIALIRAGDQLVPDAIARLVGALGNADAIYSDSDQTVEGVTEPWLKPDWDPDLFLAQGYVFGLLLFRASLCDPPSEVGEILVADCAIRALAAAGTRVAHLPEILCHEVEVPAFGAAPTPPGWSGERLAALWPELGSSGGSIETLPDHTWLARVRWPRPSVQPRVAVLIPTRDRVDLLSVAVESLIDRTAYSAVEPVILDNGSTCPDTLDWLADFRARGGLVIDCAGPFNFAAIMNRGVALTTADLVCLMNNDVEIVDGDWLDEMVSHICREEVGVVGAKLLWPNGMVQHGGVVLGIDGGAVHVGNDWAAHDTGYRGTNLVTRRWSSVTAACMLLRRADYLSLGGLDEQNFPISFNDVDLCLRIRQAGKAVVWTPFAVLHHHESASRGRDILPEKAARARRELRMLQSRWAKELLDDPCYNPNLNRDAVPFEALALPPIGRAMHHRLRTLRGTA